MTVEERLEELEKKIDSVMGNQEGISVTRKADSAGRLTLPKTIRKVLGWPDEEIEVEVVVCGPNILIKRV